MRAPAFVLLIAFLVVALAGCAGTSPSSSSGAPTSGPPPSASSQKTLTGTVQVACPTLCESCPPPESPLGCSVAPAAGGSGCASFTSGMPGRDCYFWPVQDVDGKPFTISSTGGDPDVEFRDTCGAATSTTIGTSYSHGTETGTFPAGTGCIIAFEFNTITPGGSSTITVVYG